MDSTKISKPALSVILAALLLLISTGCGYLGDSTGTRTAEPTLLSMKASARYLNLPVTDSAPEIRMKVSTVDKVIDEFTIHLAEAEPDYYVFLDLEPYQGQIIHIDIPELPEDSQGPENISINETITGSENLYSEALRQQFHFSSRRGWNNDPNGLVYLDGEYHLYYQHNPYGWPWGNMHWGHAVSTDLVHWKELPIAVYPKEFGDWAFSGSAIIDHENLSGFQAGDDPVMVAAYTSTGRGECILYSNDKGRTFEEYSGNPVITHKGRDPKLIWYEPGDHWAAAVYHEENDKRWIAFYSSPDLKDWTYTSKIEGFYECPELFEIRVEGTKQAKWILYGADGSYMVGSFDGKEFSPESEQLTFQYGKTFYASQTFNNIPAEDGRRIQIAWGRTDSPGMPFNQCMLFPVSLTLRETADGLRLRPAPVEEIELLHQDPITLVGQYLEPGRYEAPFTPGETLHMVAEWSRNKPGKTVLTIAGFPLVIDTDGNTVTFGEYIAPLPESGEKINLEILLDRLSLEIFVNDGAVYMPQYLDPEKRTKEYAISTDSELRLESLTVWPLKSIWEE